MVDWPSGCPQFKLTGIKDKRGPTKLRSSVDVGPALVRRRYTAAVRNLDVPMTFTNAERVVMDAFYIDDLDEGTLRFNWTDPVDGSTLAMRFRENDGIDWQAVEGGDGKRWNATLTLEILP